jgi:hypothetical protein
MFCLPEFADKKNSASSKFHPTFKAIVAVAAVAVVVVVAAPW